MRYVVFQESEQEMEFNGCFTNMESVRDYIEEIKDLGKKEFPKITVYQLVETVYKG